ncbi:MAG: TonB family protein [Acidocella sp.]|nr:TonB family protein [Acidocella sp.]
MSVVQPSHFISPEPNRFGRALLIAALIEAVCILFMLHTTRPAPVVTPATVQLKILPPAPLPVAVKPPPPVPQPPAPKPPPVVPMPVVTPPPPLKHSAIQHHVIQHVAPPPPPTTSPQLPVTPLTAAPPPAAVTQQSLLARYIGQVRAIVDSNLVVPQEIIDSENSGDCILAFTISPEGTLLSAHILTPSSIQPVNEAALDALRASHLPAFLPGMNQTPMSFTLPVHESGG